MLYSISEVTEKAAVSQVNPHVTTNGLFSDCTSAYQKFHSTETTPLKVTSDILMSMDNQCVTLLVLLDLSAAFDTVDYDILYEVLEKDLRIEKELSVMQKAGSCPILQIGSSVCLSKESCQMRLL